MLAKRGVATRLLESPSGGPPAVYGELRGVGRESVVSVVEATSTTPPPNDCLLTAYRRLEDIVRARTGLTEHSAKLLSQAFVGSTSRLVWNDLDSGEHLGRGSLFTAAYMAYRNPRAHHEPTEDPERRLGEFLLLNHLYRLEREAVERE